MMKLGLWQFHSHILHLLEWPWHWRVVPFHQFNRQTRITTLHLTNKNEIVCSIFGGISISITGFTKKIKYEFLFIIFNILIHCYKFDRGITTHYDKMVLKFWYWKYWCERHFDVKINKELVVDLTFSEPRKWRYVNFYILRLYISI